MNEWLAGSSIIDDDGSRTTTTPLIITATMMMMRKNNDHYTKDFLNLFVYSKDNLIVSMMKSQILITIEEFIYRGSNFLCLLKWIIYSIKKKWRMKMQTTNIITTTTDDDDDDDVIHLLLHFSPFITLKISLLMYSFLLLSLSDNVRKRGDIFFLNRDHATKKNDKKQQQHLNVTTTTKFVKRKNFSSFYVVVVVVVPLRFVLFQFESCRCSFFNFLFINKTKLLLLLSSPSYYSRFFFVLLFLCFCHRWCVVPLYE